MRVDRHIGAELRSHLASLRRGICRGSAAAFYAGHRTSFDHDHVLTDLSERYANVVEAVEPSGGWVTSVRASPPPVTLLGSLDGIEAGLRQLRRKTPVEVEEVRVDGRLLRVPTLPEILRFKSYLVVQRNQVRDYLDVVALAALELRGRPPENRPASGGRP